MSMGTEGFLVVCSNGFARGFLEGFGKETPTAAELERCCKLRDTLCSCRGKHRIVRVTAHGSAENISKDPRHPLMQRELELLRTLEEKLIERRAYEPRHSSPEHECVECEALAELRQLRKQVQNQDRVASIEARRAELLRKHKETCDGCCPCCGDHCPEEGGTSCGGHGHYGGNS